MKATDFSAKTMRPQEVTKRQQTCKSRCSTVTQVVDVRTGGLRTGHSWKTLAAIMESPTGAAQHRSVPLHLVHDESVREEDGSSKRDSIGALEDIQLARDMVNDYAAQQNT